MERIGFWQLLLDDRVSFWEAQKITSAQETAEIAQAHATDAQLASRSLQRRVDALSREVVMLRTAMTVLTRALADAKVVDPRQLESGLEAALDAAFPEQPSQAEVAAKQVQELADRRYTCLRCRQSVLASTTSMTADGPMCDRCPPASAPYR